MGNEIENLEKALGKKTDVLELQERGASELYFNGRTIDVEDDSALLTAVLESTLSDKQKADELFRTFETRMSYEKDGSDSVKEGLVNTLVARNQATTNLIKIVEIKARFLNDKNNNGGFNINLTPKKIGINLENIEENLD